jgi:hypothetical protein
LDSHRYNQSFDDESEEDEGDLDEVEEIDADTYNDDDSVEGTKDEKDTEEEEERAWDENWYPSEYEIETESESGLDSDDEDQSEYERDIGRVDSLMEEVRFPSQLPCHTFYSCILLTFTPKSLFLLWFSGLLVAFIEVLIFSYIPSSH